MHVNSAECQFMHVCVHAYVRVCSVCGCGCVSVGVGVFVWVGVRACVYAIHLHGRI